MEQIENVVMAWVEAVNRNDWEALNALYAPVVVSWASPSGVDAKKRVARADIERNSHKFYEAWPDTTLDVERLFAAGEWACLQAVLRATHTGPVHLAGGPRIEPTQARLAVSVAIVFRVEAGVITHKEEYYDSASWWRQLGVEPPEVPIVMDVS